MTCYWRLYCNECEAQKYVSCTPTPTECPTCQSEDIKDIIVICSPCMIPYFVKRGDPLNYDFTLAGLPFVADNTWRDFDLSAIVPAEAAGKNVRLYINYKHNSATGGLIMFRSKGDENERDVVVCRILTANITHYRTSDEIVMDADRKIQYRLGGGALTQLDITVRGWWEVS